MFACFYLSSIVVYLPLHASVYFAISSTCLFLPQFPLELCLMTAGRPPAGAWRWTNHYNNNNNCNNNNNNNDNDKCNTYCSSSILTVGGPPSGAIIILC